MKKCTDYRIRMGNWLWCPTHARLFNLDGTPVDIATIKWRGGCAMPVRKAKG